MMRRAKVPCGIHPNWSAPATACSSLPVTPVQAWHGASGHIMLRAYQEAAALHDERGHTFHGGMVPAGLCALQHHWYHSMVARSCCAEYSTILQKTENTAQGEAAAAQSWKAKRMRLIRSRCILPGRCWKPQSPARKLHDQPDGEYAQSACVERSRPSRYYR